MKKVLFIGAHPDDIEIGCGGTIHKHKDDWDITCFTLCTTGLNGKHKDKLSDCQLNSLEVLGLKSCEVAVGFRPSFMHEERNRVWEAIKEVKEKINPDVVFTQQADEHQDHETVFKETVRNFQGTTIYGYHIPRSEMTCGGNYFEVLSQEDIDAKLKAMKCYPMYQFNGNYETPGIWSCFNPIAIDALARANAVYIGKQYAERFTVIKQIN